MPALNEISITRLATVSGVDMKTAAKVNLYTVPNGKTLYVTQIVIRESSASMAGGTDYDFGTGANADTWRQTIDLSSMTTLSMAGVPPAIFIVPSIVTSFAKVANSLPDPPDKVILVVS